MKEFPYSFQNLHYLQHLHLFEFALILDNKIDIEVLRKHPVRYFEDVAYFKLKTYDDLGFNDTVKENIKDGNLSELGESGLNSPEIKFISLMFNIIMYLTSFNTNMKEIIPSKPKYNKKRPDRTKTSLKYSIIRQDISITNNSSSSTSYNKGSGNSHKHRYMVRGHFHCYWYNYNPKMSEDSILKREGDKVLRLKWLKPHWKGPEFGKTLLRDYIVKENI